MFPQLEPQALHQDFLRTRNFAQSVDRALAGKIPERRRPVVDEEEVVERSPRRHQQQHHQQSSATPTDPSALPITPTTTLTATTTTTTTVTTPPPKGWLPDADDRRSVFEQKKAYMLEEARRFVRRVCGRGSIDGFHPSIHPSSSSLWSSSSFWSSSF